MNNKSIILIIICLCVILAIYFTWSWTSRYYFDNYYLYPKTLDAKHVEKIVMYYRENDDGYINHYFYVTSDDGYIMRISDIEALKKSEKPLLKGIWVKSDRP